MKCSSVIKSNLKVHDPHQLPTWKVFLEIIPRQFFCMYIYFYNCTAEFPAKAWKRGVETFFPWKISDFVEVPCSFNAMQCRNGEGMVTATQLRGCGWTLMLSSREIFAEVLRQIIQCNALEPHREVGKELIDTWMCWGLGWWQQMINGRPSSESRCMLEGQDDKCSSWYLRCLRKHSPSDTGSVTAVMLEEWWWLDWFN